MKFDLVKDEMSLLLENMTEQFEMIHQHDIEIPQIEIDIFMRNVQKLYENAIYLNKINHNKPATQSENVVEKSIENKATVEEIKDTIVEKEVNEESNKEVELKAENGIKENEVEVEQNHSEENNTEVISVSEKEKYEAEKIETKEEDYSETKIEEREIKIKDEVESEKTMEPTLAFDDILDTNNNETDLFSNVKATSEIVDLNEKLAEARNTQSIVEKLQNKRIESLKTVIGINDKFYFINELFSGDSQKYEDIIYTLNNFKKLEDAMVYFSTLKYKFSWDEESEAYKKLILMLERKFELANA